MFIVLRPTTRQQHNKLLQMYIFPITQHIYYHNFKNTLSHQQQKQQQWQEHRKNIINIINEVFNNSLLIKTWNQSDPLSIYLSLSLSFVIKESFKKKLSKLFKKNFCFLKDCCIYGSVANPSPIGFIYNENSGIASHIFGKIIFYYSHKGTTWSNIIRMHCMIITKTILTKNIKTRKHEMGTSFIRIYKCIYHKNTRRLFANLLIYTWRII